MKSLLKSIFKRVNQEQASNVDDESAFYPDCYSRTSESVRRRIRMSYDSDVRDTISSLTTLAGKMADGLVEFKKYKAKKYRYDPHADSILYASKLLHAASILQFLLLEPDGSPDKKD